MTLILRSLSVLSLILLSQGVGAQEDMAWLKRPNPWLQEFRFDRMAPGCYASGAVFGTKGETITNVRAGNRLCPVAAGNQTCTANQICITDAACGAGVVGMLAEPTRIQLHPSPSTPAAGTVTFTATGQHRFSVTGSGSQALSVSGTLVATGLPCTATAAAPCSFNVTTLGATPTGSLAAVTGSLTTAQIEAGTYPSTFIASGTRTGDVPRYTWALNGLTSDWCIEETITPVTGSAWANVDSMFNIAPSGYPSAQTYVQSGTSYRLVVNAGASAQYTDSAIPSAGTHTLKMCNRLSGRSGVFVDGDQPKPLTSGTSTGVMGALPSTVYLGSRAAATAVLGGCMSTFRVRTSNPLPDWTARLALIIGDSVWNGSVIRDSAASWASMGDTYPTTWGVATYNGHYVGLGLLELADTTYAYETGAWTVAKTRGVPFASYGAITFEFGANDAALATAAYRRGYDKLLDQARKSAVPRVCAGGPPPHADNAGVGPWTAAPNEYGPGAGGHYDAAKALWTKWQVSSVDPIPLFYSLTAAGTYTVAQLSADGVHATSAGVELEGQILGTCLRSAGAPAAVTPEIAGSVVNELFGEPISGTWTLSDITPASGQVSGMLNRIAGYTAANEKVLISSTAGAVARFRAYTMSEGGQVWIRFFVDDSTGGNFTWYIDRGQPGELTGALGTLYTAGNTRVGITKLLADNLPAGSHQVEIVSETTAPVRILGVTYVGAP